MAKYESNPGMLFHNGEQFSCQCGLQEFKVEVGPVPPRYWCPCGELHTEESVVEFFEARDAQ